MFQAYHMIQLKTETSREVVTKLQLKSFDRMKTKQETTIKIETSWITESIMEFFNLPFTQANTSFLSVCFLIRL